MATFSTPVSSLAVCAASLLALTASLHAQVVSGFSDLEFTIGTGAQQAGIVIDFRDGSEPLAWGYRWDGALTGQDLVRAVTQADPRLFSLVAESSFGDVLVGIGYDQDSDGFDTTPALGSLTQVTESLGGYIRSEDPNLSASTDALADDFTAIEAEDSWASGWSTGFWSLWVPDSSGNAPVEAGGGWDSASVGFTTLGVNDGDWIGWSWAPGFASAEPGVAIAAPVPEPATFALAAALLAVLAILRTRLKARSA